MKDAKQEARDQAARGEAKRTPLGAQRPFLAKAPNLLGSRREIRSLLRMRALLDLGLMVNE